MTEEATATALTWDRRDYRRPMGRNKGKHWYASTDGRYSIVRGAWQMRGKALTSGRASYGTTYTMKGWAVYNKGRYVTRRRTLELAKEVAELHAGGMSLNDIDEALVRKHGA